MINVYCDSHISSAISAKLEYYGINYAIDRDSNYNLKYILIEKDFEYLKRIKKLLDDKDFGIHKSVFNNYFFVFYG